MADPNGPGIDPASIVVALNEHAQRLVLPPWPVFALTGPDVEGFLSGASEHENGVVAIRFDYRAPDSPERLVVQTQPDDGRRLDLPATIETLREHLDDGNPLRLSTTAAAVDDDQAWLSGDALVDGRPVPALVHSEAALMAWQVLLNSVTVVAVAWQTPLDRLALTRVDDLMPLKLRRALVVEQWLSRHPLS